MEPSHIGRFEIYAVLGQGGMGTVYKAHDPDIDRWVAIKTVTIQGDQQHARFKQEIRAAGKLKHSHIVIIHHTWIEDDVGYIVMELVEGGTLAERFSPPIPWNKAVRLLLPICQALAYAHDEGVVHRDVKPANILISNKEVVKLTDFGVARLETTKGRITTPDSAVGTLFYIAPEQANSEVVDGRADIFSLGIVLFELITGRHPFAGEGPVQVFRGIIQPEPADLEPLSVFAPPPLVDVARRALNKSPADRFDNADEMAAALKACLKQPSTSWTPLSSTAFTPSDTYFSQADVSTPLLHLDLVSDVSLSSAERALLEKAFVGYDTLHIEKEFKKGFSGARVLLATPVRSGGRWESKIVLKIDNPAAINDEWQAYKKYVEGRLPLAASIPKPPTDAGDEPLALLYYTFAGGRVDVAPDSLRNYYKEHTWQKIVELLEESVLDALRVGWWGHRQTKYFSLRQEYDRLLPVHLVVEVSAPSKETPYNLIAGKTSFNDCRLLKYQQEVYIEGFAVEEIQPDRNEITLYTPPRSSSQINQIRIRVRTSPPNHLVLRVGDPMPPFTGVMIETRHDLLHESIQSAYPEQDLNREEVVIGGESYPNPLYHYDSLLNQRVFAMRTPIHGDLNLENILVVPSGPIWVIDFATTREGPILYDLARLETQVITRWLAELRPNPESVVHLMQVLHQPIPSFGQLPTNFNKPFQILAAIRHAAKNYLNSESWDEYYQGLSLMLLGALKFKDLDVHTQRITYAAAVGVYRLIGVPVTPQPPPPPPLWRYVAVIAGFIAAVTLVIAFWFVNHPPPPTESVVVAVTASLPRSTDTPPPPDTPVPPALPPPPEPSPTMTPTIIDTPTPIIIEGKVLAPFEIYGGPGPDYPTFGSLIVDNPVQVTGRDSTSKWWQIIDPGAGGYGWVPAESVELLVSLAPPVATALPPSSPTPSPAPSPTPPCPREAVYQALPTNYPSLGCSTDTWQTDFTLQRFERGLMIWRKSPAQIYILYEAGNWRSEADPQGPPYPSCPEGDQTAGLGPIFSFGVIWCAGERAQLGRPITKEIALEDSQVEQFEQGLAFGLGQYGYVLFEEDKQWTLFQLPSSEPADYQLFFAANLDGQYRIYRMTLNEKQPVSLTNGLGDYGRPALSPDGQLLAYGSNRNGNMDIFVLDLSTQEINQLTSAPEHDHTPAWSPDGRRIAFQSERAGNYDIYVMNSDGSNQIALTNDPANDYWPTWSPDGKQILFESERNDGKNSQLYLMQADGSDKTRLIESDGNDGMPAWSLSGEIVFYSDRDGNRELYLMDNLKAIPRRLTNNSTNDWFPAWSPDGRYLAFVSGDFKEGKIYVMDRADESITTLVENGGDSSDPIIAFAMTIPANQVAPESPPECSIFPALEFQTLWNRYGSRMGCPLDSTVVVIPLIAEELFQGGHMFWRSDTDDVYAVYDRQFDGTHLIAGRWEYYGTPWDGSNPDGVGLSPPPGLVEPKRGFGWLWRTKMGGSSSLIGWALDKEYGFENIGRVQQFERGVAFKGSDTKVYALLNDGGFLAVDPNLDQ